MTVASPLPIGRIQAVVGRLVQSFLPAGAVVVWSHQQRPRDLEADIVGRLRVLTGPEIVGVDSSRTLRTPEDVTITIASVPAGGRVFLEVNDVEAFADAEVGDDVEALRDRWITAIEAIGEDAGVEATASGTDAIELAPTIPGGIFRLRTAPAGVVTVAVGPLSAFEYVEGPRRMTLELQLMVRRGSAPQSPRNGATDLAARVQAGLAFSSTIEALDAVGVGIEKPSTPVDLTTISGGETESRCAMDLVVVAQSVAWEAAPMIEVVGATIATDPDDLDAASIEFEATDPNA